MKLTKQHFEFIAATIKTITNLNERNTAAWAFVKALQETNPAFNHDRFLRACGTLDEE